MASVNKVIIVGNLGRDPEVRYTADNSTAICHIVVATSRRYKDSQGEIQEETEWHRVVIFGKSGEAANQYLRKGSSVYIEGYLRTRKYTDKEGIERYATEIVGQTVQFLNSPRGAQAADGQSAGQTASAGAPAPAQRQARPRQSAPEAQAKRSPAAQARQAQAHGVGQGPSITDDDIPF